MRWNGRQLEQARLAANMSRGDLAHRMREVSSNEIKPTERSIRGWEHNENEPVGTAAVAAAQAIGVDVAIFYSEGQEVVAPPGGDPFSGSDGAATPTRRGNGRRRSGEDEVAA